MRAYYASKLSENISETPEAYLICKNVPIARTGTQEYYGEELGLEEYRGQKVIVHREDTDVFDPAALASFEGKPITDEHPGESVTADNALSYLKGVTKEVRRGEGEDSDKVLADLVIYDKALIHEIQGGKREISCGYDCIYKIAPDGTVYQQRIRGNHVAVVPAGRAGSEVAIRDSTPKEPKYKQPERRKTHMAKVKCIKKASDAYRMFLPLFAKDADPEEVQAAMEAVEEALSPEVADAPDPTPASTAVPAKEAPAKDEEMPPWAKALVDQLAAIQAQLATHDEDPIKKLEDELTGEQAVSKPAEEIGKDEDPTKDEDPAATDGEPLAADEDPTQDIDPAVDEKATAATDRLLKLVRAMKPAIATIKDAKAKKAATDALVSTVRGLRGAPVKPGINGYALALDAKAAKAAQRVNDAAVFDLDKQQEMYDRRNPHKMKGVK